MSPKESKSWPGRLAKPLVFRYRKSIGHSSDVVCYDAGLSSLIFLAGLGAEPNRPHPPVGQIKNVKVLKHYVGFLN
jgi:hypothetical protein